MTGAAWDDLQLFFHVAQEGGLSGAAGRTGLSAPTIGRRMLALERTTGRTLFVRSQQGYRLAHDGEILLAHVRTMRQAADQIADWHGHAFAMPIVSISGDAWIAGFVADHAAALRGAHDAFRLCCGSAHGGLEMNFRAADIAILRERPASGNLAVLRSVRVRYAVYRSNGLAANDAPTWISIGTESAHSPADRWVFENHESGIVTWTTSPDLLLRLIRAGAGQGVLPVFVGDRDPALMRVGGPIDALEHALWIVANDDDRHRPEVRLIIQRLAELMKQNSEAFGGDV